MRSAKGESAAPDLLAARREVAAWLEAEIEPLSAAAIRRMQEREPEFCPAISGQGFEMLTDVEALIESLTEALRQGVVGDDAGAESVVPLAVAAARAGLSWQAVAAAWSGCQAEIADALLRHIGEANWGDTTQASEVMRASILCLLGFDNVVDARLASAYHQSRDRAEQRAVLATGDRLDDLLIGREAGEADLGFDLDCDHVASIAWGDDARRGVEELGGRLGCEVTIEQRRDLVWGWLHGSPEIDPEALSDARQFVPPPTVGLALGNRHAGKEGFITSHHEARSAKRVAVLSGAPVTLFIDVGLEAFALSDERLARAFVARELGPLVGEDSRSAALRRTLEAYFAAGNSASGAAAALDVHERTVSYRIRAAEERLGRYFVDCQDEVALALRLRSLFASAAARAPISSVEV